MNGRGLVECGTSKRKREESVEAPRQQKISTDLPDEIELLMAYRASKTLSSENMRSASDILAEDIYNIINPDGIQLPVAAREGTFELDQLPNETQDFLRDLEIFDGAEVFFGFGTVREAENGNHEMGW